MNAAGQISDTPLHLSCSRGYTDLSLLLINRFNPNSEYRHTVTSVILVSINYIYYLIVHATDNERHLTLHIAARLGLVPVIEALLRSDQNVNPHSLNIYKDTPLHM